jgi:hypothetical protein
LTALYVPNEHTAAGLRYRARSDRSPILFTPLHRLELRTTVRQCAYTRLITQHHAKQILRSIEEDLDDGTLVHEPVSWTETLRQADRVAERLAWAQRCRTLDLWHVAIALEIEADAFITFDLDQFALAKAVGLRTIMPH